MISNAVYRCCLILFLFIVLYGDVYAGDNLAGTLTNVRGKVEIIKTDTMQTKAAKPGDSLSAGELLSSGENSLAQLVLTDDSVVNLLPESSLLMAQYNFTSADNRRTTTIKVRGGGARFVVYKQRNRDSRFTVETGHASVSVGIADFFVNASPKETEIVNIGRSFVVSHTSKLIAGKVHLDANQKTVVAEKMPPSQPTTLNPAQRRIYLRNAAF
jgi:hypothetical protein